VISRGKRIAIAFVLLGLSSCAEMPAVPNAASDADVQELAAAGDWAALTQARIRCDDEEDCAKRYATLGDACLRLVIEQPQAASTQQERIRRLLTCAEQSYRDALERSPPKAAPARVSYHGGLLLTLSEWRNRLDGGIDASERERANQQLLMAAQDARREVPSSALGYLYGASAHVYRAALKPNAGHRCSDLRQAEAMLRRSPPPPPQLVDELGRIQSLVARELRESRCPTIRRQ